MTDSTLKECTKCHVEYPNTLEHFSIDNRFGCLRWQCRNCQNKYQREWDAANRDWRRQYRDTNREEHRRHQRKYAKKKRETSIGFKVSGNIGGKICRSLKGKKSNRHWESLVGYTLDDLVTHLESQFAKGMTWDNYGHQGWHIEHIRPISDFSFESPDDPEFLQCWSLWNLQPMWAQDNWKKGARCDNPPLPLVTKVSF